MRKVKRTTIIRSQYNTNRSSSDNMWGCTWVIL